FPLLLGGTLNGNTDFTFVSAQITNGSITITPPPPPKGSISGEVFKDTNGNGKLDKGETGLAGWVIDVYTTVNGVRKLVEAAVTDKYGNYKLDNLDAGTYDVYVEKQQTTKYKPTGKSVTGYHVVLGS